MKSLGVSKAVLVLTLASSSMQADEKTPASISVAFGAGLNTAQPGNTPNHHVIPQEFTVRITKARKLDGTLVFVPATVNFVVSGFHWIWVYNSGVTLAQVRANIPATGTFVNYDVNVFAKGVNPGTPPAFADVAVNPSGVMNRTDSFGFSVPGRYLVICNVRGHLLDGMYAWINVVDDDRDGHSGHGDED
jgi:plastocyanin